MKNIALKSILSTAALVVTAGLSMNAAAGQLDETLVQGAAVPTQTVSFTRSELATTSGREAVERRVRAAAKEVCGSQDIRQAGGLSQAAKNGQCFEDALAGAMSQIGADQVAGISN